MYYRARLEPCGSTNHQPNHNPTQGFFHVNIFDDGGVCLSILKDVVPEHLGDVSGWRPSFTVTTILVAIQVRWAPPIARSHGHARTRTCACVRARACFIRPGVLLLLLCKTALLQPLGSVAVCCR